MANDVGGGPSAVSDLVGAPVSAIAASVKSRRKARGWSMRELARRVGVSQPFISKLEGGQLLPSVHTLYALAAALGVKPSDLLPEIDGASSRAELHMPITDAPDSSMVHLVAGGPGMTTQVYHFTLEQGESGDEEYFDHGGEEVIYVIEGEIVAEYFGAAGTRVVAGGSLTVDPRKRHRLRNSFDGRSRVLLICTDV